MTLTISSAIEPSERRVPYAHFVQIVAPPKMRDLKLLIQQDEEDEFIPCVLQESVIVGEMACMTSYRYIAAGDAVDLSGLDLICEERVFHPEPDSGEYPRFLHHHGRYVERVLDCPAASNAVYIRLLHEGELRVSRPPFFLFWFIPIRLKPVIRTFLQFGYYVRRSA